MPSTAMEFFFMLIILICFIAQKLQIRQFKNDNSKCYYDDLQEMADERNRRRQIERAKERELSFDVSCFKIVWIFFL